MGTPARTAESGVSAPLETATAALEAENRSVRTASPLEVVPDDGLAALGVGDGADLDAEGRQSELGSILEAQVKDGAAAGLDEVLRDEFNRGE